MTIPAPSTLHFRQGRAAISKEVYPDLDAFFDDLANAYRAAIRAFYDAGCRYLQLDDTAWSMLCDPNERAQSKKRGDDPDSLPARYARLTTAALQAKPADMAITMHSCRGNFRSTFIASGGYDFVAEQLLGHTTFSNMTATAPADSSRCGSFPEAKSSSCSGWLRRRPARWRAKTRSSGASTKRQNMSRWISCVYRRNAASPRPRKATSSRKKNSGPNCG
jgi:5-methyltetrahydropteroyltriglutamate--homocysteine methyltransferase